MKTATKQDINPYFNPFDYAIWGASKNKTNATSLPNIGSLKTAIEKEWNKMSEVFILKACKSFRRCVDTIIEKNGAILSKFTVLCLSFNFVAYYLKYKLILFYNKVVFPYTIIFIAYCYITKKNIHKAQIFSRTFNFIIIFIDAHSQN